MHAQLSAVLSQITPLTDRRTNGQTELSSLGRVYIPCSAVNICRQYQSAADGRWNGAVKREKSM